MQIRSEWNGNTLILENRTDADKFVTYAEGDMPLALADDTLLPANGGTLEIEFGEAAGVRRVCLFCTGGGDPIDEEPEEPIKPLLFTNQNGSLIQGVFGDGVTNPDGSINTTNVSLFDCFEFGDAGQSVGLDSQYTQAQAVEAATGVPFFTNVRQDIFRVFAGHATAEAGLQAAGFSTWADIPNIQQILRDCQAPTSQYDFQTDWATMQANGYVAGPNFTELANYLGGFQYIDHPYEVLINMGDPNEFDPYFLVMDSCKPAWQDAWCQYMATMMAERPDIKAINVLAPKIQWYDIQNNFPQGDHSAGQALFGTWIRDPATDIANNNPSWYQQHIYDFEDGCGDAWSNIVSSAEIVCKLKDKVNQEVWWMPWNLNVFTWRNPTYRQMIIQDIMAQQGLDATAAETYMFDELLAMSQCADRVWMPASYDPNLDPSEEWYNAMGNGNHICFEYPQST